MKIVKVTYTVREEYTPVNSANIKAVMAELRTIDSDAAHLQGQPHLPW